MDTKEWKQAEVLHIEEKKQGYFLASHSTSW